jgi:hypothetical protein
MSVSVPGANHMMRDQKNAGSAESGAGVSLFGFYVPNAEVGERLRLLDIEHGPFSEIALHESEGWTFFIGASEVPPHSTSTLYRKVGFYRRESHKFFEDLPAWLFRSKAIHVHRLNLSQSSGFLSLTWLYSDEPVV